MVTFSELDIYIFGIKCKDTYSKIYNSIKKLCARKLKKNSNLLDNFEGILCIFWMKEILYLDVGW